MIDHYENPRNVGSMDKNDSDVGTGLVGAPACGDVMKLQVSNILISINILILKVQLILVSNELGIRFVSKTQHQPKSLQPI